MDQRLLAALSVLVLLSTGCSPKQDFYGRVVDQYGHPVEGATALGTLLWRTGIDTGEKREQHFAQSDKAGDFQFTGYHADRLAVAVKKDGYDMGVGDGIYEAPNAANKTSSTARAVFHMWKFRGLEPLFTSKFEVRMVGDGTPTRLDPSTGRRDSGELVVSYRRTPEDPKPGKAYDGAITLEMRNGGLIETTDPYPYDAPVAGYQPSVVFVISESAKKSGEAHGQYYFFDGQRYGLVDFYFDAGYVRSSFLKLRCVENPSGSRNLELRNARNPFP